VLTDMFPAIDDGKIKAIYLMGENPVLSDPDARHIEESLQKLDFLVVQDIFLTETAKLADVVLPAASFAEKDGTFTNTERRVQLVRKAISSPGNATPDWQITCDIAMRMKAKGFDYASPTEIFAEIAELTPAYGGLSHERLENGGLQWPCPLEDHPGTKYLHADMFVRGLVLTTGRSLYQFHTGTMTRKSKGLNIMKGEEEVEMNPRDAEALGIADGDRVSVTSRRGEVNARVKVTGASQKGTIFMTFHFAECATNLLTNTALDPVAKIPELKVCAVKVEKLHA